MPRPTVPYRSHVWPRVAVLVAVGVGLAGCADSARFDSNPYASNRRASPPPETTGSIGGGRPMYRPAVEARPLPAPSRPATVAANTGYSSGGYASGGYGSGTGYASGSGGLGAYRPSAPVGNDITGSVQAPPPPPQPAGHWTWDGGRPVTVGRGETVETIARKYGVPASAIMQTNNVASPTAVRPGQRLVIPRYVSNGTVAPVASHVAAAQPAPAPAPAPATPRTAAGDYVHVVQPGESLIGLSRRYNVPLSALAKANNLPVYHKVAMGDRVTIPGGARHQQVAQRPAPVRQPATQQVAAAAPAWPQPAQPVAQPPRVAAPTVAKVQTVPVETARVASEAPAPAGVVKQAEATGSMPSFRWPVKGRIIAGFGQNANGATNDGINLAVPEGTPVKAAEDGVVAYAGNELKGYGNLVLVRHANGYVSAYANASELLVKRGDSVKRGQTIAHAGQTGNVTSPQLHFEIRKGSTPVDPTKYLGNS